MTSAAQPPATPAEFTGTRDEPPDAGPGPDVRVGDTVTVVGLESNGAYEHPGIVTRVWDRDCVNVTVLPDNGAPVPWASLRREGSFPSAPRYTAVAWRPRR